MFCAGSEEFIKCDLVLLAMGFLGPEKKIVDELKAKLDPNVYAAGGEGTDVGQSYLCSQVKRLCSEHARTSYNVFILAHVSQRLK